ncbi:MAG TPA: nucleotide exchange factor GrpE [Streptosporangiaceae bacterium]|nr:nucleotide exchange factor GrpE [Streptosporangiaceae bacterium]
MSSPDETGKGPVIRDMRRIDPYTGRVRGDTRGSGPAGPVPPPPPPPGDRGASRPGRPGKHAASKPGRDSGEPRRDTPASAASSGTGGTGAGAGNGPGADATGNTSAGNAGAGSTSARSTGAGNSGVGNSGPAEAPPAAAPTTPPAPAVSGGTSQLADQLAERTADLQRVSADFANYRKRVERDRQAVREQALANVLSALLPVLDDIGRAREHGELIGGFKSVGESLEAAMAKLGLVSFGDEGEPFDPRVHEALAHSYSPDVTEVTCVKVLQPGYRVGERTLRPARVVVAEPQEAGAGQGSAAGDDEQAQQSRGDND